MLAHAEDDGLQLLMVAKHHLQGSMRMLGLRTCFGCRTTIVSSCPPLRRTGGPASVPCCCSAGCAAAEVAALLWPPAAVIPGVDEEAEWMTDCMLKHLCGDTIDPVGMHAAEDAARTDCQAGAELEAD